jgi:GT2 family glycosyltransferase
MKASVIVLAWNGMEYLEGCLDAVLAQDYPDFEVIVVDNGSTDGSADFVAARYPQVRLIRNERNLGFAGGNNVGLRAADGDVLVLLNQDTEVQAGWLKSLVEPTASDANVGIVGAKALYPDGTLQHAGGHVDERGEGRHYGYQEQDHGQYDRGRDVDYVTGASLAITRRAYEVVGGLDEGFDPAYFEDVDWCYRVRNAGFRVLYEPRAVFVHKETSVIDYDQVYVFERNRLRFVLKHWPLDRLTDEFLPGEQVWLESWGEGAEWLISAVHHAYIYNLLRLSSVVDWREKVFGKGSENFKVLTEALFTLRSLIPLLPARIQKTQSFGEPVPEGTVSGETSSVEEELLERLHQQWTVEEYEFDSDVPILGPLIAAFRRGWNRISTKWYVDFMFQQQTAFNAAVVTMLERMVQQNKLLRERLDMSRRDRELLGRVLAEYISESGREIAELAYEMQRAEGNRRK